MNVTSVTQPCHIVADTHQDNVDQIYSKCDVWGVHCVGTVDPLTDLRDKMSFSHKKGPVLRAWG